MPGFEQLMLLLLAAVIMVPLAARLGLGAVLGYLLAGVIVGPWSLGVIGQVEQIMHVAEFGVILLLFVIGLELRPTRLWALRKSIFGFGSAQVLLCAAVLAVFSLLRGEAFTTAVVVGLVLALSSTAFALQLIAERGEMTTRWGRSAFGTLLFQDLAVVPLLAVLPLLGAPQGGEPGVQQGIDWSQLLLPVGVLLAVLLGGRYFLRQVLRVAARSHVREILTATALLVAFGTALLLEAAGLSMALGAFIAGVLLADSEFRHQLEADIEPFKGLLLGLFFISVGMSLNLGLLRSDAGAVALLVLAIVAIKLAVLYALGRYNGLDARDSVKLGIALSQGGEFAFVLFGVAMAAGLMTAEQVDMHVVAVSLSMVVTPLLFIAYDRFSSQAQDRPEFDEIEDDQTPVIIVGFGRFGQVVARILSAMKIRFTALDASPQQVDFVRLYGNEIYYGDGSRIDLLEAAGAHHAKILVLAIDDVESSVIAATHIRAHFPQLNVFARARNRHHAYRLMDLGITVLRRETLLSAADMGREVLENLGVGREQARALTARFVEHDERRLHEHHSLHNDEEKLRALAKEAARELEEMFARDASELLNPEGASQKLRPDKLNRKLADRKIIGEHDMSYFDTEDPRCNKSSGAIALLIEPRAADLGEFSVRRALPSRERRMVGPFVFFDHMGPAEFPPGSGIAVRPHPHIGIATITYLFEGEIIHRDSLGVVQPIQAGAVNLMVAGRGIVHSERAGADLAELSHLHGIQSWIALPQAEQECDPAFTHYGAADLPTVTLDGAQVRIIMGSAYGQRSPVTTFSETLYLDCQLSAGAELSLPDHVEELACYVAVGEVAVDETTVKAGAMAVACPGKVLRLRATADSRVMVIGGANIGPRQIYWNFVSDSQERIEQAKRDWRDGKFPTVPGDAEFIPLPG